MTPEVQQTLIVMREGRLNLLFVTDHGYYGTTTGAFGQREMTIEKIATEEAKKLLSPKKANP